MDDTNWYFRLPTQLCKLPQTTVLLAAKSVHSYISGLSATSSVAVLGEYILIFVWQIFGDTLTMPEDESNAGLYVQMQMCRGLWRNLRKR